MISIVVDILATLQGNLYEKFLQIRGSLKVFTQGNPEPSRLNGRACVETRWRTSQVDEGIVRYFSKEERTLRGVSLVPTIVSAINTAKNTPNAPTGLSGLLDVLAYVNKKASLKSNLHRITCQIRGNLRALAYGNPELSGRQLPKCVETRWQASLWDGGIVRYSRKLERTESFVAVILLGAVAWIKYGPIIQKCVMQICQIRGTLKAFAYANPELSGKKFLKCVETRWQTPLGVMV